MQKTDDSKTRIAKAWEKDKSIQPRDGDLFYGLSNPITDDPFGKSDMGRLADEKQYMTNYPTINPFNNKTWAGSSGAKSWDDAKLNVEKTDWGSQQNKEIADSQVKYLRALPQNKQPTLPFDMSNHEDLAVQSWKRGSKAGIYNTAVNNQGRIHFSLEGVSMDNVINKKNPKGITDAELRMLYRRRNDKALMSNVTFYNKGAVVNAPWVGNEKQWSAYTPKNKGVYPEVGGKDK